MKIEALLVDLDGTLLDTVGDFVAALTPLAAELGAPAPSEALVRRLIGRGGAQLLRDLLAHWGLTVQDFEALRERYECHYRAVNGQRARLFEGVVVGLEGLRALGLRLACVTNKPQANAQALLERFQLAAYFELLVGGAQGLRAKPAPDSLLQACAGLGLPPARCLMVGDSANDAAAARAAGCAGVVLLRHGYNHGEPIEAVPAEAHLDGLDQLPAWLSDRAFLCPAAGS
ncbi:HAD-IA family hydrolase [Inhella proteolytica]|uniref:Phosphoglycolate phosphatase n=1 Tax=Inhella proteolytica TaxID=2795029 RepID=A0A931JBI7_9BURK|nr:HAD-IA family hydrolase [Inhella proteolytica]MBH9579570.1 HAD-IA family hydrolase [Inhella proteolytica]